MRTKMWGTILTLIALAACSGPTPTSPVSDPPDKSQTQELQLVSPSGRNTHNYGNPRGGSMTRRTWKSAAWVAAAAHEYAADNGGLYPTGVRQPNALGHTLIDYLPGGRLLINPFTGNRTEPRDGPATHSGAVGYREIMIEAYPLGFTVEAMGFDTSEMLYIEYKPE